MTLAGSTTILNVQELHKTGAPGRWMFLRYDVAADDRMTLSLAQDTLVSGSTEVARLDAIRRSPTGAAIFGTPVARCVRQPARERGE